MAIDVIFLSNTSTTNIDTNFARLNTALEQALSRDGNTPNSMSADFDMNGNDIINTGNFDVDTMTIDGATIQEAIDAASSVGPQGPPGADGADGADGVDGIDGTGAGDMLIATYDPTAVGGDAFAMDSMVEGITTKILTDTERTKLSGIETAADVTDEINVTNALDGATLSAITKTATLKFLVQDDADNDVLKTATVPTAVGGGPSLGDNSIIRTNAKNLITAVTLWELNLTATVDAGADTIDQGTDDGFLDGDVVQFVTTTTLPAGLSLATDYYVRDITATTMKVALTYDGVAVDITDTGTGTHTIYRTVNGSSVGPIELNAVVTVSAGSTWSIT